MKIHAPLRLQAVPDAVLLDMDNTLYPYEPAHRAGYKEVVTKAHQTLGVGPADFGAAYDQARDEVKARLRQTASSHSRLLYFQRTLEILGLGSQVLMSLELEQAYWRAFLLEARLFAGARGFLDDLRLLGIPVVIVTDLTAQIQFRKLVFFGLEAYVDYVVTSEEAGVEKPDIAPFLLALEKLAMDPECVWVVGDHAARDVAGGRAVPGSVVFQKMHSGVAPSAPGNEPDAVFSSFDSLRSLLGELAGDAS